MDENKIENEKPKYDADRLTNDFSFFCADYANLIKQIMETPFNIQQRFQITGAVLMLCRAQGLMNETLKKWGMLE